MGIIDEVGSQGPMSNMHDGHICSRAIFWAMFVWMKMGTTSSMATRRTMTESVVSVALL